ncbi:beta strand repeat-containing protein [Stutzerimonas balearica]|uniref:beta strand repeat-containing protein n=1 Tax=Stutzerimonas balearica TaxID=74829 RepID=UPI0028A62932|nr:hypothetical protein [Stutzerimonas balearica]
MGVIFGRSGTCDSRCGVDGARATPLDPCGSWAGGCHKTPLTTGADKGAAFTGTDAAETFNAAILTLTAGDELDGGAGADVLNATINTNIADTVKLSNIETVNMTLIGARDVDTKNFTGVEALWNANSTGKLTLQNVASPTMALGFRGNGVNNTEAQYVAGALQGTADKLTVALDSAKDVTVAVSAGFETAQITSTGSANSIAAFTAPGVTSVNISGAELTLKAGVLDGIKTVDAREMTGALLGTADTDAGITQGFVATAGNALDGAATGSSLLLGNGDDNIGFQSKTTASTQSDSILMGGGNNKLYVEKGVGSLSVLAQGGNDTVLLGGTNALTANDIVSLGAGNDTVIVNNGAANQLVLAGVESLTLTKNASHANAIVSADSALTVTAQADNNAVGITGLTAGSTFTTVNAANVTTGNTDVTVGFKNTEAASTLTLGAKVQTSITTSKISAVTINAADTVDGTITVNDATDLTINAAKAVDLTDAGGIVVGTNELLKNVTVTGSDAVDLGTIANDAVLETVAVTAAKAATVGDVDATNLKTVSVTSTTGAASVGKLSNTAATVNAVNIAISGATTATLGDVNASAAGKVGNVTVTATKGLLDAGYINATELGTVALSSTDGAIKSADIDAADATGITVNLSAKTFISSNGTSATSGDDVSVDNSKGGITASIAGAAAAVVDFEAGTSLNGAVVDAGVVNLSASNTGGLISTITNSGAAGSTSTVTLGNAGAGKSNAVTFDGMVDTLIVTGGSGTDFVTLAGTFKNGAVALAGGTDTLSFEGIQKAAGGANAGVVVNLSSSAYVVEGSTVANNVSVAAGTARELDTSAAKKVTDGGFSFTVSGVEKLVGTAGNDIFVANTEGTSFEGKGGDDTIVLGAGADTVVVGAQTAAGMDTVIGFAVGTDKLTLINKGTETFTATAVDVSTANGVLADALDLAAAASTGSTNGLVKWFVLGTDTYVVQDNNDATSFDASTDVVVKLAGVLDLSSLSEASFNFA